MKVLAVLQHGPLGPALAGKICSNADVTLVHLAREVDDSFS